MDPENEWDELPKNLSAVQRYLGSHYGEYIESRRQLIAYLDRLSSMSEVRFSIIEVLEKLPLYHKKDDYILDLYRSCCLMHLGQLVACKVLIKEKIKAGGINYYIRNGDCLPNERLVPDLDPDLLFDNLRPGVINQLMNLVVNSPAGTEFSIRSVLESLDLPYKKNQVMKSKYTRCTIRQIKRFVVKGMLVPKKVAPKVYVFVRL